MNKATEYLKSCGTFYLATDEEGQPHVRPFGAVCEFEGKLSGIGILLVVSGTFIQLFSSL